MAAVKRVFKVNGKPFYPLGRHRIYMGGYSVRDEAEIETNFKATKFTNGNTVCLAIFWDQLEPEEGKFDFSSIDTVIKIARRYDLRLIFLWFASSKNGVMDYAPAWMKSKPEIYKRATALNGTKLWVLSTQCKANLEADKKVFAALCEHLKATDSTEQTVIGLQVENEPGILGSDRDYGPEVQAEFDSSVPAKLIAAMKKSGKGDIYDIWQKAGGKDAGTWPQLFGDEAGELFSAYGWATYIEAVAKAGKAIYDIPMFINVWVSSLVWWPVPGECYPSGCPVTKVLDIYKWFTPHIDIIAPDNPHTNIRQRNEVNAKYARDDNQLLIVEAPGMGIFHDIADFNAVGYFLHFDHTPDGTPKNSRIVNMLKSVAAVIPLLLKYQGTGKIQAVEQEEGMEHHGLAGTQIDFDGYMGLIEFGDDHGNQEPGRGAGLVIQASKNEFYLVGINFRLLLRRKPATVALLAGNDLSHISFGNYLMSVDEGHFDKDGKYISDRRRNGDSVRGGTWVGVNDGVVRIITCD
jgi:hypothetical protein